MNRLLITIAISVLLPLQAYCQSADAGISSMENELRDRWQPSITLTYMYGTSGASGDSTERNMKYYSVVLSGEAKIFSGTSIWASLPLNQQDGLLGSVTGVGDLIVIVNQQLFSFSSAQVSVGVGGRFATATTSSSNLPQAYQSGLGSNDLIIDADLTSKSVNFGIGYQLAGSRNISNITQLERGDEFIIRGGYTYRGDSFLIGAELLAIQQVQASTASLNPITQTDSIVAVAGTDKLQIDFLLKARYNINSMFGITGTIGVPFTDRNVNIDGLTRSFNASVGLAVDL